MLALLPPRPAARLHWKLAMSLFPHHKLDWNLSRLEKRLDGGEVPGDDTETRVEFALACVSRGLFHESGHSGAGGEPWLNKGLTAARRVLTGNPGNAAAHAIAALALTELDRLDAARTHLDQALRTGSPNEDRSENDARTRYAAARWHEAARRGADSGEDRMMAVREAEAACRLDPEAWEPHALLAGLLWDRAQAAGGAGAGRAPHPQFGRMLERSQFHAVRALELDLPSDQRPALLYHLGITNLHTQRYPEASKLLSELLEDAQWRARAQYYLGLVNYHIGKYKNAILYLRQHLEHAPDTARVHARIAMAHLQLGEVVKARESCNRALALDPSDLSARWTLGCALVEEGREDEAVRTFKAILEDSPEHASAFTEIVRLRSRRGDATWLVAALRAEVKGFDQLRPAEGGKVDARQVTRDRIRALVDAVGQLEEDALPGGGPRAVLDAVDLTSDESLRFLLWEALLDQLAARRARTVAKDLEHPGRVYSAKLGRELLVLARALPEELLVRALDVDDDDLRRAAVERHGPTRDVADHRKAVDSERREARAWQALLLLAIASHGNRSSRGLLARWAEMAGGDADLADAARAGLVILGDPTAETALRQRARERGMSNLVDAMQAQLVPPSARMAVRPLAEGEERVCTTCGRRPSEAAHMMVGAKAAICNVCLGDIAMRRRELETDDPEKVCALSGRGTFETAAMYVWKGTAVCREVVDSGLGLLERERVDRWLAAL
jgi:tetratricopeptide (TPR) repeat protein